MVDFVPSTNELKKLKFLSPGPKNSSFGAMKSVTRHTIKVERFSLSDTNSVDNPKGKLLFNGYQLFIYWMTDLTVSITPTGAESSSLVKQESYEKLVEWNEKSLLLLLLLVSLL